MTYQPSPTFRDQILICRDCGESFTWTSGEQKFYYAKGLSQPTHCPACRERRKRTLPPPKLDDIITRAKQGSDTW